LSITLPSLGTYLVQQEIRNAKGIPMHAQSIVLQSKNNNNNMSSPVFAGRRKKVAEEVTTFGNK